MTSKEYFDSKEFEDRYHYEGKLGSFCGDEGTDFLLWAPTADVVTLRLYPDCLCEAAVECISLVRGDRGVWSYHTQRNLDGTYYTYAVTVAGITRETADPYARACGVNGERSMVIDLRRTDPEGWQEDHAPDRTNENIIYEIHVKDFTWDKACDVAPEKRGKFLGLCQRGTTLNGDGIHPTGMDYVKYLGVTHVQLLPVFDYATVNEVDGKYEFNWGYDPWNFNVPDGSYASDPYHGEVRIRELKTLIQELHRNGIRVIMDVVYNHTYQLDSFLNRTVPGYYYRFEDDGTPSDGSRCGNDTASERSMCARYILDSVLYWAEEYHFDGFRFDLMGLMPVELMNRIRRAMDDRFGEGEIMLYGEPWRAADTAVRQGTILADKEHLHQLDSGVGAFCDATRDAVKGNLMDEKAKGFVNGGEYSAEILRNCIRGWCGVRAEYSVGAVTQTINYLSCHDDWTLWDRLINSMDADRSYTETPEAVLRANRLAAAILCSCQGNLFLLSGEEFARTKEGVKNSFASSIELNRIDWNRGWNNKELIRYYRGLFSLRMQLSVLYDKSNGSAARINSVCEVNDHCIRVEFEREKKDRRWQDLLIFYNFGAEECEIPLPSGRWQLLVDGMDSERWKEEYYMEGGLKLSGVSAAFLGR